ncbi:MAG: hypothetical protein V1827_02285 [Candidatus Micrarchaeota archaeon]
MTDIDEKDLVGKVEEESKESNVKCSFCGNEAFCGPCKDEPEKSGGFEHMCYECFQKMGEVPENVRDRTHMCIPPEKLQENFQRFLDDVTMRAFQDLWNAEKKKLKDMSRQDLAQAAFFEGATFMFHFMQRMSEQPPETEHVHEEPHPGHHHDQKTGK